MTFSWRCTSSSRGSAHNPVPSRMCGDPYYGEAPWCFVFTNVDGRSPWAHWLLGWFRPGFRHAFALRDDPAGLILVQLTTARLQVEVFPGETVASRLVYTREIEGLDPITVAWAEYAGDGNAWVPRLLTCVGVLRALAGMRGRIQTPWGLARELHSKQ